MIRFIELTAVDLHREHEATAPSTTELDDLERPVVTDTPQEAASNVYFSVMINPDDVREFYPRKGNRVGTRVVFKNGAARPVKETYEEVKAKFQLN